MKRLINYFLKGLLIFAPIALTIFAVVYIFTGLDEIFRRIFRFSIPGLGFVVTIALITVIGFLASNFIGEKFFAAIEKIFNRLPLVRLLYSALKDLFEAFAGRKKKFDKPCLVNIVPKSGVKVLGFITQDTLDFLNLADHVSVYLPQSYNFAGNLIIVPAKNVIPIEMTSSDAMTFIVSGGVSLKNHPAKTTDSSHQVQNQ